MTQCTDSLSPIMALGPDRKLGIIRDTAIQPFRPKKEEIEIRLNQKLDEVTVILKLSYQPRPGDVYPINEVRRTVQVGGLFAEK